MIHPYDFFQLNAVGVERLLESPHRMTDLEASKLYVGFWALVLSTLIVYIVATAFALWQCWKLLIEIRHIQRELIEQRPEISMRYSLHEYRDSSVVPNDYV